jgi:hypothetical protein
LTSTKSLYDPNLPIEDPHPSVFNHISEDDKYYEDDSEVPPNEKIIKHF